VVFIFLGYEFLRVLNIPTPSFQLAGSFILFTLGLSMVTGRMHEEIAKLPSNASILERAVYPLAMPAIAGAGAILTVVMLTDNHARIVSEQFQTTFVLALCLSVHLASFMAARLIVRFIGLMGIQVITRVFGLMICSIAVSGMVIAIKLIFGLN
jgi:multiple antibiotic resistance protein